MPTSHSDLLTTEEVSKIVESSFKTNKFKLNSFHIKPLSDNVVGFLGEHLRLIVKATIDDKEVERSFFVKSAPTQTGTLQYDYTVRSGAFKKEISVYSLIVKEIEKMNKCSDENCNSVEMWCPKFHFSRGEELLVLEDISNSGYKIAPERQPLDKEHVLIALQTLAQLHSSMFIFEKKLCEEKAINGEKLTMHDFYPELTKEVIYTIEKDDNPFTKWFRETVPQYDVFADLLDGYSDKERSVIRKQLVPHMKDILNLVKSSTKYKNILIHGDLWPNNFLFQYENDKPIAANLVDFQLVRYGTLAQDIMAFLYLSTEVQLRKSYEREFQLYYYREMEKELKKKGESVNDLISWEDFLRSCEDCRKYAMLTGIITLSYVLTPPSITDDAFSTPEKYKTFIVDKRGYFMKKSFEDIVYSSRLKDICKEFVNRYVLV